jgi:hypothetical protein
LEQHLFAPPEMLMQRLRRLKRTWMLTMLTTLTTLMTGRIDCFGACSIALLPFWCLDAKGGEVVLFRYLSGFAWVEQKLERLSFL